MDVLLDEEEKMVFDELSSVLETKLECSVGHISLSPPDCLKGWILTDIKTSSRGILTVMTAPLSNQDIIDKSILALWHVADSSQPYR